MYPIIEVHPDVAEISEAMGSKFKFWFHDKELGRCLFKQGRPGTGEDWAEKVVSEVATILGIPHATYHLAEWRGLKGVVSPSFVPPNGIAIHGNELLVKLIPDYDSGSQGKRYYRAREHRLTTVVALHSLPTVRTPRESPPIEQLSHPYELFIGYLVLDALVGNTDRHHENWGFVVLVDVVEDGRFPMFMFPTFDHASSLGRELSDESKTSRLTTNDAGFTVSAYCQKAHSALYGVDNSNKSMTLHEVVSFLKQSHRDATNYWISQLNRLTDGEVATIVGLVPENWISRVSREFAIKMIIENKRVLLEQR